METKLVTYKHLTKGQRIEGVKGDGWMRNFIAYVKEINPVFVIVELWKKGGEEERFSASCMFMVEITKEEFQNKYRAKAKEVLKNIQNRLHRDQIGYHEMWNAWLYGNPYEIARQCVKENITIVGHCSDIIPKTSLFSDEDIYDVGVCAEYESGERFWCHFKFSMIENMIEEYKELLKD